MRHLPKQQRFPHRILVTAVSRALTNSAPQLVDNNSQTAVWSATYDPYGTRLGGTSNVTQNQSLPGQYRDAESGFNYNWNRDYSTTFGRYLQADPIGLNGALNPYLYVGANPVAYVDPLGLKQYDNQYLKQTQPLPGREMTDCEKSMMSRWYPKDILDRVRLINGIRPDTSFVTNGAARGQSDANGIVYVNPADYQSEDGVAILGHELLHQAQRSSIGDTNFDNQYWPEALRHGIGEKNKFEKEAYDREAEVKAAFAGQCTCMHPQ